MKAQWLSWRIRFACAVGLSALALGVTATPATTQEEQGVFITQASARLTKLIDSANKEGFKLKDNSFSIGGGWIKQSKSDWVNLYKVPLTAGRDYRFLAAGDNDAKDVDLEVLDPSNKVVVKDDSVNPDANVTYRPTTGGLYTVRIRLYDSRNNLPCVCLGIVMVKAK